MLLASVLISTTFSNPLKIGAYIIKIPLDIYEKLFSNPLKIGAYIIRC